MGGVLQVAAAVGEVYEGHGGRFGCGRMGPVARREGRGQRRMALVRWWLELVRQAVARRSDMKRKTVRISTSCARSLVQVCGFWV